MTTFNISEFDTGASGAHVFLPVFNTSEDSTRRETRDTARMNAFYKSLAGYIGEFVLSQEFPQGGRYRADSVCRQSEDGREITVVVSLSLHHRGRCSARRTLCHTWRDGVIVQ